MFNTLLSSFIGVVPLSMLLLKNMGRLGGAGNVLVAAFARKYLDDSSGESSSSRKRGISVWYFWSECCFFAAAGWGAGEAWTRRVWVWAGGCAASTAWAVDVPEVGRSSGVGGMAG